MYIYISPYTSDRLAFWYVWFLYFLCDPLLILDVFSLYLLLKNTYILFLFVQRTTFPKERVRWRAPLYSSYLFIPSAPLPRPPQQEVNRDRLCYHTLLLVWGTQRYRCTFSTFFFSLHISRFLQNLKHTPSVYFSMSLAFSLLLLLAAFRPFVPLCPQRSLALSSPFGRENSLVKEPVKLGSSV